MSAAAEITGDITGNIAGATAQAHVPPDVPPHVPRGVDWREYAMCHGRTGLFFAKKAERPQARERREARARQLCTVCPVQSTCRAWARDHREYGYWGGENEEDRHLLGYTVSAPIGIRARQAGSPAAG